GITGVQILIDRLKNASVACAAKQRDQDFGIILGPALRYFSWRNFLGPRSNRVRLEEGNRYIRIRGRSQIEDVQLPIHQDGHRPRCLLAQRVQYKDWRTIRVFDLNGPRPRVPSRTYEAE